MVTHFPVTLHTVHLQAYLTIGFKKVGIHHVPVYVEQFLGHRDEIGQLLHLACVPQPPALLIQLAVECSQSWRLGSEAKC